MRIKIIKSVAYVGVGIITAGMPKIHDTVAHKYFCIQANT
jgi:hypothetical protein